MSVRNDCALRRILYCVVSDILRWLLWLLRHEFLNMYGRKNEPRLLRGFV